MRNGLEGLCFREPMQKSFTAIHSIPYIYGGIMTKSHVESLMLSGAAIIGCEVVKAIPANFIAVSQTKSSF
jgi:hypothetical protein